MQCFVSTNVLVNKMVQALFILFINTSSLKENKDIAKI